MVELSDILYTLLEYCTDVKHATGLRFKVYTVIKSMLKFHVITNMTRYSVLWILWNGLHKTM